MVDEVGSDHRAVARQEIQNAWWNTSLLEDLHEHGGAHDRLLGRFHDHRVTRYDPGRYHSTQDGDRKIPRRNDERDATSPIVVVAFLAGNPLCKLRAAETAHLLRVKAAKINRFADIGIGFIPRFAHFEDFNRREFVSPPFQNIGGALHILSWLSL